MGVLGWGTGTGASALIQGGDLCLLPRSLGAVGGLTGLPRGPGGGLPLVVLRSPGGASLVACSLLCKLCCSALQLRGGVDLHRGQAPSPGVGVGARPHAGAAAWQRGCLGGDCGRMLGCTPEACGPPPSPWRGVACFWLACTPAARCGAASPPARSPLAPSPARRLLAGAEDGLLVDELLGARRCPRGVAPKLASPITFGIMVAFFITTCCDATSLRDALL